MRFPVGSVPPACLPYPVVPGGGGVVSAPRVDVCPEGGGCLPGGRKVSAQGVSAHGEGCLPRGGVSA